MGDAVQGAGVRRVIQSRPDVVAHPSVDGDVRASQPTVQVERLDRAHLVQGEDRRTDDRPTRLDGQPRRAEPVSECLALDDGPQPLGDVCRAHRVVSGDVRDAQPTAEIDLRELDPVQVVHPCQQVQHAMGAHLEGRGVEDLRADVAVDPDELEPLDREHPLDGLLGGAGSQREPELLILMSRRHELVGVRLDAHGGPDEHPLPRASTPR